jgi:predicted CxxxxCH...CXXCH cytochrome family protein
MSMGRVGFTLVVATCFACLDGREAPDEAACVPTPTHFCSRVHEPGLQDPESPDFHGKVVRAQVYDVENCRSCHGDDLRGGASGSSCQSCHETGVFDCATCHPQLLEQGAHRAHVQGGQLGLRYDCDTCHLTPKTVFSPGHFQKGGVLDPAPVEVVLAAIATSSGAPAASFDRATGTCQNVVCHGVADAAASLQPLSWTARPEPNCGRCHGDPPASHTSDRCQDCHPRVANAEGLTDPARHLDGQIDLGDGSGTCNACHVETGAHHEVHASAVRRLRGPIGCVECHLYPTEIEAPGHLDSLPPGEVFPRGFGGLAEARGAQPNYADGRCANTYCHGPGSDLALTDGPEVVYCGSCHGVPPIDVDHQAEWTIRECQRCHSASVDDYGNPRFDESGRSRHLDGIIDP